MTQDTVLVLSTERIRIEMNERHRAFAGVIGDISSQLAQTGNFNSGRRVVLVAEAIRSEAQIRAAIAWNTLVSVVGASGRRVPDLMSAGDAKTFIDQAVASNSADLARQRDNLEQGRLLSVPALDKLMAEALEKTHSDIDIAFISTDAPGAHPQVLNVYQTFGIVQTGAASSAHLSVTPEANAALVAALAAVHEALAKAPDINEQQRVQAVEVVEEVQVELRKPSPNRIRLQGALTGLASTIQTLGSAAAAYNLLKGAAALVGVSLP